MSFADSQSSMDLSNPQEQPKAAGTAPETSLLYAGDCEDEGIVALAV